MQSVHVWSRRILANLCTVCQREMPQRWSLLHGWQERRLMPLGFQTLNLSSVLKLEFSPCVFSVFTLVPTEFQLDFDEHWKTLLFKTEFNVALDYQKTDLWIEISSPSRKSKRLGENLAILSLWQVNKSPWTNLFVNPRQKCCMVNSAKAWWRAQGRAHLFNEMKRKLQLRDYNHWEGWEHEIRANFPEES